MTTATDTAVAEPLRRERHPMHAARLAFRRWRHSRPFWGGVWAMLGGALIAYLPATAFRLILIASGSVLFGILVGVLVGFFGLLLWLTPQLRVILGILILVLSLGSFFTSDFGGLILGMLMGLIGGSLALAWVPTKVTWRQRRRARKLAAAGGAVEPMDSVDAAQPAPDIEPAPETQAVAPAEPEPAGQTATLSELLDPPAPEPTRQHSALWRLGRHRAQSRAD